MCPQPSCRTNSFGDRVLAQRSASDHLSRAGLPKTAAKCRDAWEYHKAPQNPGIQEPADSPGEGFGSDLALQQRWEKLTQISC